MTDRLVIAIRQHAKSRRHVIKAMSEVFGYASSTDDAQEFLQRQLKDGPKKLPLLNKMATEEGINHRTLRRAAIKLEIRSKVTGFGKDRVARWRLP